MVSWFARMLLIATSLAPILIVYGASLMPRNLSWAAALAAVAVLLAAICLLLLRYARTRVARTSVTVTAGKNLDSQVLSFLIAYLLPLLVQKEQKTNVWALVAFVAVMFVVLATCNIYHVNPLMGMLGYHFFEVTATSGTAYLLITRRNVSITQGSVQVVTLSPFLLLEAP